MARRDWESAAAVRVGVFLNGDAIRSTTARGEPVHDDSLLLLFNGRHEAVELRAAAAALRRAVARRALDRPTPDAEAASTRHAQAVAVAERSVVVLTPLPMRALIATYRLQLGPDLTFAEAAALVPYLRDLGISHLYLSPILQARRGSTHGYDVVDPRRVSDALGGEAGLRALAAAGARAARRHRAEPHGGVGREPVLDATPACGRQFFDLDPRGGHRRFFDIDELAGVRVEDPEVFAVTHGKIAELVRDGVIAGVRVDHIDGLADPAGYLQRLRERRASSTCGSRRSSSPVKRCRRGRSRARLATSSSSTSTRCSSIADGLDALDTTVVGRRSFHDVGAEAKAEQVRSTFRPEVRRLHRLADVADLEAGPRCTSGVPDLPRSPDPRRVGAGRAGAWPRCPTECRPTRYCVPGATRRSSWCASSRRRAR